MSAAPAGMLPRWLELWTGGWVKNSNKKSSPIVYSFYCCLSSVARWKWIILFLAFWCINLHTTIFCFFTKAILSADWGYLAAVAKISDPAGCTESCLSNFSFQQYINILLLVHFAFVPESNCCSVSFPPPYTWIVEEDMPLFTDGQDCCRKRRACLYLAMLDRGISAAVIVINRSSPHLPWKQKQLWYGNQPFLFL